MAKLTQAQTRFLEHHDIPLGKVFDATGMRRSDYQCQMSALGKLVAIGVSPCSIAGHTMRTRAGHCAECRPAVLAYMRRYDAHGEVYVATTAKGRIVKVGSSTNAVERISSLNIYKYGGVADWHIAFHEESRMAGRAEFAAHKSLSPHTASGTYFKDGRDVECRELFCCSVSVAIKAVRTAIAHQQ